MDQASVTTLHFFCGKVASGKSTLARQLVESEKGILISEDLWLSRLYPDEIQSFDDYLKYAQRLKVTLTPHIIDLLKQGNNLVLDFPGNVPAIRAWVRSLFEAAGAGHVLHYLELPDEVCKVQLAQRNGELPEGSVSLTEEQFDVISGYFEPPTQSEGFNQKHYRRGTLKL